MGASAWLCRPRPPASPPELSSSAGRGSADRCPCRFVRRARRGLVAALLVLPLLATVGPAQAQTPHAAPKNLQVTTGDGRATLSWQDPNDESIDRYQFRYKRSDRLWSAWADIGNSSKATTTVTLTGLQNGVSYRFQLRAVSDAHDPKVLINDDRNDPYFPVYIRDQGTMYLDLGKDTQDGIPIARYFHTNEVPNRLTTEKYNSLEKWQYRYTTPRTITDGRITLWHPWQTPWVDMTRGSGTCGVGKERICFRMQGLKRNTYYLYQFRMVFGLRTGPAAEAHNVVPGDPPLKLSIAGLNRPFTQADFDKEYSRRNYRMLVFTFSEKVTGFTIDDIDVECAIKETQLTNPITINTIDGEIEIYRLSVKPTICQEDTPKVKVTVKARSVQYEGSDGGMVTMKYGPEHAVIVSADCAPCAPTSERKTQSPPAQQAPSNTPACPATDSTLVETVRRYHGMNSQRAHYNHNWHRVLIAFGAETHPSLSPYTAAEARRGETRWSGWRPVRQELERLEACPGATSEMQRVAAEPKPLPTLSVRDTTAPEGGKMTFTVDLSEPSTAPVCFDAHTRDSTPVSATARHDYWPMRWDTPTDRLCILPGDTHKPLILHILNDAHDDPDETFELVISKATGATIDDAVGVGTITNADPLPAAYLSRFGRTVAEQALEGIAGRMAADRAPGMRGTLAGEALSFDPVSGQPAAGAADDGAAPALAEIARGFGAEALGPGGASDPFGYRLVLDGPRERSRTMGAREALLGSSFALTGERDGSGGSLAFWGRAGRGSFEGAERGDGTDIALDGTVTTAMLGADYARGDGLVGIALTQSTADGKYASEGDLGCPEAGGGARVLCDGAVRAGDGRVKASLTAAIPYAALQASERLNLWGALGYGTGEVTLETAMGGGYSADTDWTMAAVGLRGELLAPPAEGGGPALALTSDALWARTASEKTRDLAASEADVTRLGLGLEGSWHMALEGGGALVPKLEIGARHDGGDAETGSGLELGGGLNWTNPGIGLSFDLSGRALVAHENGDLKDRGISAALTLDPAPETKRGLSLSLRQDFGGRAEGGLDALFAPDPLEDRTGSEAESRWAVEAAYGLPAFGGRWTGSPHAGIGLATSERDYSLGWRLTPEAASAPDLSFGVRAMHRESEGTAPEHTLGFELDTRW